MSLAGAWKVSGGIVGISGTPWLNFHWLNLVFVLVAEGLSLEECDMYLPITIKFKGDLQHKRRGSGSSLFLYRHKKRVAGRFYS